MTSVTSFARQQQSLPFHKNLWRTLLIFIALVAVFTGCLLLWRNALTNNDFAEEQGVYAIPQQPALIDYVPNSEFGQDQTFSIKGSPHEIEDLSLLLIRASIPQVSINGEPFASYDHSDYQNVRVIPLRDHAVHDSQTDVTSITVNASGLFLSYSIYLGNSAQIDTIVEVYHNFTVIMFTVFAVMLIYALSLFAFKTSERYLAVFAMYIVAVTITYLVRNSYQPTTTSLSYSAIITSITAFKYCAGAYTMYLFAVESPPRLRQHIIIIMATLLIVFARGAISSINPSPVISETSKLVLLFIAAGIVIKAHAENKQGFLVLFVGYDIYFAIELTRSIDLLSETAESTLPFALWGNTAIFELPFALACMIFINYRFANSYKQSELLSNKLAELNHTLDATVEQRTQEALEQRGHRHSLMLNVFHDLRSPLFVLRGCIDMLKAESQNDPPQKTELIDTMSERVSFISNLTEDLFTLAKLEDDDMPISFSQINFSEIVEATVTAESIEASEKHITLEANIEPNCIVWGNAERLGQIVQNLITNAIFYTPDDGLVTVSLQSINVDNTSSADTPGPACSMYELRISDTGQGIEPEDLDKIFTKYYRTANNGKKGSTGLGLSIARGLIERHKGTVEVQSERGKGSTFMVRLPKLEETNNS